MPKGKRNDSRTKAEILSELELVRRSEDHFSRLCRQQKTVLLEYREAYLHARDTCIRLAMQKRGEECSKKRKLKVRRRAADGSW